MSKTRSASLTDRQTQGFYGLIFKLATIAILPTMACASVQAACCYFAAQDKDINQPGQKAFITWNPNSRSESFTVQPKFTGNAVDFGMVIPTPSRPKLDEMPRDFFKDLAIYTILMPLPQPIYTSLEPYPPVPCCAPAAANFGAAGGSMRAEGVRVLESGVVGSLDYKIIVAQDASGLYDWLKANKYSYGGDEATLDFYIKKQWFFTVMKIDSKQMKKSPDGTYLGEVNPTRFSFSSNECIYPLKITQISVKDKTDALFYVQSTEQMDLPGDWSWMPSYRLMYLTYMLGCAADPAQQKEYQERTSWLNERVRKDSRFETTKLEWSKKLGQSELSVLDDPLKNYGQMGIGDLPPGSKVISLQQFLDELKAQFLKKQGGVLKKEAELELARYSDQYQPSLGVIVKNNLAANKSTAAFNTTAYTWYPARQAPQDGVKGLSRLKGHLQNGQWLTKFRKQVRKEEMTKDIVLSEVPKMQQQTYIRIMPSSPP